MILFRTASGPSRAGSCCRRPSLPKAPQGPRSRTAKKRRTRPSIVRGLAPSQNNPEARHRHIPEIAVPKIPERRAEKVEGYHGSRKGPISCRKTARDDCWPDRRQSTRTQGAINRRAARPTVIKIWRQPLFTVSMATKTMPTATPRFVPQPKHAGGHISLLGNKGLAENPGTSRQLYRRSDAQQDPKENEE
jgi:hypothetical protein